MSIRPRPLALTALVATSLVLAPSRAAPTANASLERVWAAAGPSEPEALAVDAAGVVAVGRLGEVVALDVDGEEQWREHLGDAWTAGPVAVGDDVIAVAVDRDRVVVLDRSSGAIRWAHAVPDVHAVDVGVSAGARVVAAVSTRGVLEVLDATTGGLRWATGFPVDEAVVVARPWVAGEVVLLAWTDSSGSHLRALAGHDGNAAWSDDTPGFASAPVVRDGSVLFAANDRVDERERMVARIRSLALADGTERWARRVRSRQMFWSAIGTAVGDGAVAVVDLDGRVSAVDARTGRLRWRTATGLRQVEAEPHVVGGVLAMTTYGTGLLTLALTDGEEVHDDALGVDPTAVTVRDSVALDDRLALLLEWSWGDTEVWVLEARPA